MINLLQFLFKEKLKTASLIISIIIIIIAAIADLYRPIIYQGNVLPGQIGRTEGKNRIAEEGKDKYGFLTYGPYALLSPDEYKIQLEYSASSAESGSWDIIYTREPHWIIGENLPLRENGLISHKITVLKEDIGKTLEIRTRYSGRGTLKVSKIVIKKHVTTNAILIRAIISGILAFLFYAVSVRCMLLLIGCCNPGLNSGIRSPRSVTIIESKHIDKLKVIWISFFMLISIYILYITIKYWDIKSLQIKIASLVSLYIPFLIAKYLFKNEREDIDESIEGRINKYVLFPLSFNITLLILAYYASYETGVKAPFFKIGFYFDNFRDFYFNSYIITIHEKQGIHDIIANGYYPFSLLLAKFFGGLLDWGQKDLVHNTKSFFIYILYFLLCISPIIFLIKDKIIENIEYKNRTIYAYIVILFFITSYPFLFAFERGNYALVSLFFITFALIHFEKDETKSVIYLCLFLSLKLVNIAFLPFLFLHYKRKHIVMCLSMFIVLQMLSLFFLMQSIDIGFITDSFKDMLKAASFGSSFALSDTDKAICTSSIDTMRAIFYLTYNNITTDTVSENNFLKLFLISLGLLVLVLYYIRSYKRVNYIEHGILLIIVPILFHSNSVDYTMVLLFPFTILYLVKKWQQIDVYIAKFLITTYLIMNMFPFHFIHHGAVDLGRFVGASMKNFMLPVVFVMIIYMLIAKQSKNYDSGR